MTDELDPTEVYPLPTARGTGDPWSWCDSQRRRRAAMLEQASLPTRRRKQARRLLSGELDDLLDAMERTP